MRYNLINQDAFEAMTQMPDESFDACLCDPPYGIGFMGKGWDHGVPSEVVWAELLRVLKPGAFLIAFGGTRTYHRLTCAVEDAGFEIRDCLMWVYGTGFPKSHNISKALDKAGGISPKRQAETLKRRRKDAGMSKKELAEIIGCTESSVRDWEEGRSRTRGAPLEFMVPSEAYREKLTDCLGYSSDERTQVGLTADRRGDGSCYGLGHSGNLTGAPASSFAKQFDGYGTALKPAWEPCILAMKPLDGTFANNAATHGVAGLNIDDCRVETNDAYSYPNGPGGKSLHYSSDKRSADVRPDSTQSHPRGRWPANVIHDGSDEATTGFPVTGKSSGGYRGSGTRDKGWAMAADDAKEPLGFGDTGSAARYFYCAKASRKERDVGCERNPHPTVKPLALCKYLATLILPPEARAGKIIVPFSGSGSEMLGAAEAGWEDITGIESDTESGYIAVAEARLNHYKESLGEKI